MHHRIVNFVLITVSLMIAGCFPLTAHPPDFSTYTADVHPHDNERVLVIALIETMHEWVGTMRKSWSLAPPRIVPLANLPDLSKEYELTDLMYLTLIPVRGRMLREICLIRENGQVRSLVHLQIDDPYSHWMTQYYGPANYGWLSRLGSSIRQSERYVALRTTVIETSEGTRCFKNGPSDAAIEWTTEQKEMVSDFLLHVAKSNTESARGDKQH